MWATSLPTSPTCLTEKQRQIQTENKHKREHRSSVRPSPPGCLYLHIPKPGTGAEDHRDGGSYGGVVEFNEKRQIVVTAVSSGSSPRSSLGGFV